MQGFSSARQVPIALGERSYQIAIGRGLLDDPAAFDAVPAGAQALVVTNTIVAPLYAERLERALAGRHSQVRRLELPDGERYKNWESLNLIFDALLRYRADRKTVLYALGGGVVGDMTGF
ncbi:MAG: 3-dehydroquinate synthase, partial [Burkholderiaceae bacterium]|nr:3-dehydroquinate synthase [Burkholderiaceae bacterium]